MRLRRRSWRLPARPGSSSCSLGWTSCKVSSSRSRGCLRGHAKRLDGPDEPSWLAKRATPKARRFARACQLRSSSRLFEPGAHHPPRAPVRRAAWPHPADSARRPADSAEVAGPGALQSSAAISRPVRSSTTNAQIGGIRRPNAPLVPFVPVFEPVAYPAAPLRSHLSTIALLFRSLRSSPNSPSRVHLSLPAPRSARCWRASAERWTYGRAQRRTAARSSHRVSHRRSSANDVRGELAGRALLRAWPKLGDVFLH